MKRFNFKVEANDSNLFATCGLSEEQASEIHSIIELVMNENLDLAIEKEIDDERGQGISVSVPCSVGELAQAAAEKSEELTPEISFFIGVCVHAEMVNSERHKMYIMSKKLGLN